VPPIKRLAFVHHALVALKGADPAAIGAAVTTELCGAVAHDGECRWPHNNEIHWGDDVTVRTVFLAPESEEREVRLLIRTALRSSSEWVVLSDRTESLTLEERAFARRLRRTSHHNSAQLVHLVAHDLR
jgi:hypothetical protein